MELTVCLVFITTSQTQVGCDVIIESTLLHALVPYYIAILRFVYFVSLNFSRFLRILYFESP